LYRHKSPRQKLPSPVAAGFAIFTRNPFSWSKMRVGFPARSVGASFLKGGGKRIDSPIAVAVS
jgi:hypothetical protein